MTDQDKLLQSLRDLHSKLSQEKRKAFHRDLPFEELVFDRWERAKELGFGDGSSIYHNTYVMFDVKVGKNTWIGPSVMLDGRGGLCIGDWCSISAGVHIYTHDTVQWSLTGGNAEIETAPVQIGNCTYIGSQSIILPGVSVGDHCVIGAGSLVKHNIPDYSIAVGTPARITGSVNIESENFARLNWQSESS